MKSIEFDENQLGNMDEIAKSLFADENDPASYGYKRTLERPDIHWGRLIAFIFMIVAVPAAVLFLMCYFGKYLLLSVLISVAVLIVLIGAFLKKIVLGMVRLYQRFAPDSVREKCRFEPSCSHYMIMSVDKYGVVKGVAKGVNRLRRCNTDGGGFDYP